MYDFCTSLLYIDSLHSTIFNISLRAASSRQRSVSATIASSRLLVVDLVLTHSPCLHPSCAVELVPHASGERNCAPSWWMGTQLCEREQRRAWKSSRDMIVPGEWQACGWRQTDLGSGPQTRTWAANESGKRWMRVCSSGQRWWDWGSGLVHFHLTRTSTNLFAPSHHCYYPRIQIAIVIHTRSQSTRTKRKGCGLRWCYILKRVCVDTRAQVGPAPGPSRSGIKLHRMRPIEGRAVASCSINKARRSLQSQLWSPSGRTISWPISSLESGQNSSSHQAGLLPAGSSSSGARGLAIGRATCPLGKATDECQASSWWCFRIHADSRGPSCRRAKLGAGYVSGSWGRANTLKQVLGDCRRAVLF